MNLSWIPPDHSKAERIEADPEGYLEFQTRGVIRQNIEMYGRRKAEFLLSALFEDEASRIIQNG